MPATKPDWYPDPQGRHELRYWDGTTWTEHVSNRGVQSVSPVESSTAAGHAGDFGALGSLDAEVLWQGERKSLTTAMTGGKVVSARYVVTSQVITFSAGLLSTKEELVPMRAVVDADLRQSMTQKSRGVGDLLIKLDASLANRYGQHAVKLESIEDPRSVREIILKAAHAARTAYFAALHERNVELSQASANKINVGGAVAPAPAPPAASASPAAPDKISQLKELAALRDSGVLTEEEFQEEKRKILQQ